MIEDESDMVEETFCPEISQELSSKPSLTPIEAFQLFFSDELFQAVSDKTNKYADSKAEGKKKNNEDGQMMATLLLSRL